MTSLGRMHAVAVENEVRVPDDVVIAAALTTTLAVP